MRVVLVLAVLAVGCASGGSSLEPSREPLYSGQPLSYYVRRIHDLHPEESRGAAYVMAKFGRAALPFIEEALQSDQIHVRENAAYALYDLAHLSPLAEGVVPLLLESLGNECEGVRLWSVGALGEMRPTPPGAEDALKRMLADPAEAVRESAREKLDGLGKEGSP